MAGRQPKPTKLKLLTGNPGKRALNDAEPTSPPLKPDVPAWLEGEEAEAWKELVEILGPMGFVEEADRQALAMIAVELARYREANKAIRDEGLTVQGPEGPKVSPYVRVANASF